MVNQMDSKLETKFNAMESRMSVRITKIKSTILELNIGCNDVQDDLTATYDLDQSKDKLSEMEAELKKKDGKITELSDKIDELRNRSMKKTFVLRGFPEKVEGTRD